MSNDECRRTKEGPRPNDEARKCQGRNRWIRSLVVQAFPLVLHGTDWKPRVGRLRSTEQWLTTHMGRGGGLRAMIRFGKTAGKSRNPIHRGLSDARIPGAGCSRRHRRATSRAPLWSCHPTRPLGPTGGPQRSAETGGRMDGTVGRPSHNEEGITRGLAQAIRAGYSND
jgi:hypothetical protein